MGKFILTKNVYQQSFVCIYIVDDSLVIADTEILLKKLENVFTVFMKEYKVF